MEGLISEQELKAAARTLLDLCRGSKLTIAAAESCTGGLLAATLTEIPGSSDVFDRGFVTYSNDAKHAMLGVPLDVLAKFGAVSRESAEAMARGALPGKPVGLVHFAVAARDGRLNHAERQFGDIGRAEVRRASVAQALAMLRELALVQPA